MKKIISLLLVFAMMLSFAACGGSDENPDGTEALIGSQSEQDGTSGTTADTDVTDDTEGLLTDDSTSDDTEDTDTDDETDETNGDEPVAPSESSNVSSAGNDVPGSNSETPVVGTQSSGNSTEGTSEGKGSSTSTSGKPASTSGSTKPTVTTKPSTSATSGSQTTNTTKPAETTTGSSSNNTPTPSGPPAPSYPLKGDIPTDPNANYNIPKVDESRLYIGSGPLTEDNIYIGTNEFMFSGLTLPDFTGDNLWSDSKVKKLSTMMTDRSDWCTENGIEFYFVICPNKASVYGDYMPSSVTPAEYTRCDQIVDYLKANSSANVIDLRSTLTAARATYGDELFFKYDSHWTQTGGFVAYSEIMKHVKADLGNAVVYTSNDFNITYYETYMRDMPYLLGFYDKYAERGEKGAVYSLKNGPDASLIIKQSQSPEAQYAFCYEWPNGYRDDLVYAKFQSKNTSAPKLYMYRDSFGIALVPFFKESFSESIFDWDRQFSRSEILDSGADVVIIEVVEKYLSEIINKRTFID